MTAARRKSLAGSLIYTYTYIRLNEQAIERKQTQGLRHARAHTRQRRWNLPVGATKHKGIRRRGSGGCSLSRVGLRSEECVLIAQEGVKVRPGRSKQARGLDRDPRLYRLERNLFAGTFQGDYRADDDDDEEKLSLHDCASSIINMRLRVNIDFGITIIAVSTLYTAVSAKNH